MFIKKNNKYTESKLSNKIFKMRDILKKNVLYHITK